MTISEASESAYGAAPRSEDETRARLRLVRQRIAAAAERSGRSAFDVRLLPVSKTVSAHRVQLAVQGGCLDFGENRVQEAKTKADQLHAHRIGWSIIGHLQTNKVRDVVAFAHEVQSIDSQRLAEALDRRLVQAGRPMDVWVQVNTSGEESKFGVTPEALRPLLSSLRHYDTLRIRGLMTLALLSTDHARVRSCFRLLRGLRDRIRDEDPALVGSGGLSMGMSSDYETAVEEGSSCVRIGQAIFGTRSTPDSLYWPHQQQSTGTR